MPYQSLDRQPDRQVGLDSFIGFISKNPGPEGQITVYIYRSSDNALMSTHELLLGTPPTQEVQYTNEACAIAQLQTSRVFWTDDIELNPSEYNDPEGYYIVWERCCRNQSVVNIINPTGSGMT